MQNEEFKHFLLACVIIYTDELELLLSLIQTVKRSVFCSSAREKLKLIFEGSSIVRGFKVQHYMTAHKTSKAIWKKEMV